MKVLEREDGSRFVVATRRFSTGETILSEEPCFHFCGSLARASLLAVAAFDRCVDQSFLRHFALPSQFRDCSFAPLPPELQPGRDAAQAGALVAELLSAPGAASSADRIALALALAANAHPTSSGTGLFRKGAMFEHRCLGGNVRTRAAHDSPTRREWFAGRDVQEGEELEACYIDQSSPVLLMGTRLRRRFLAATKLFECRCKDCAAAQQEFCRLCKRPFAAGTVCGACKSPCDNASLLDQEDRLFELLVGGKLGALGDEQSLELLRQTREVFGPLHWAEAALALALMSGGDRPRVFDEIASTAVPMILFRRDGARRLARVSLEQTKLQLERVVQPRHRAAALGSLVVLAELLQKCKSDHAFREEQEERECEELIEVVSKTIFFAGDPVNRPACCVACAMAADDKVVDDADWGPPVQDEHRLDDGDEEDFEVAEEYDDIVL